MLAGDEALASIRMFPTRQQCNHLQAIYEIILMRQIEGGHLADLYFLS